MLETYLRKRLEKKDILLMTHIVLGYPSLEQSFRVVETMVEAGVDLMELQIPFSEPIADGPVILGANQEALKGGIRVQDCLDLAGQITSTFDIPFLIMSYYNIFFRRGVEDFVFLMAEKGLKGAIIPDLPPEEAGQYLRSMEAHRLSPIFIFSPTTPIARMRTIASLGKGLIYCVARKGVTGARTRFSKDLSAYLAQCRRATSLPLALGFGVGDKQDVTFLKGKADIAVIGTRMIQVMEKEGLSGVGSFLKGLQEV